MGGALERSCMSPILPTLGRWVWTWTTKLAIYQTQYVPYHNYLQLFKTWSGTLQAWRARWSCPGRRSRGGSWLSWRRFSWLGHTPREKEYAGHNIQRFLTVSSPISNCYWWNITSIWSRRSSPEGSNFFIDAFRFIVDQLGKVGWIYIWNWVSNDMQHNIDCKTSEKAKKKKNTLKSGSCVTPGQSSSLGVLSTRKIRKSWSISESP